MAVLTKTAESVFAPYNIDGTARSIVPQDAQVWGTEIEVTLDALSDAGTMRGGWDASSGVFPGGGTAALGDAWLVETAGTTGGVTFGEGDRIVAIIVNPSTSLYAGNWQVIRARGRAYIPGTDAGAGTANAIQITTPEPVLDGSVVMFQLFRDTTSSPVTVSANGGTALMLKTNRGNAASALTAGMDVWFRYRASDNTARMLNDQDVSALVAQAEAAAASVNLPAAPSAGDFLRRNAGNTAYEALTGPEVVTALNVKALNADGGFTFSTTTTAQPWNGPFSGTWDASHIFASDGAAQPATNAYGTVIIKRTVSGAGANGPTNASLSMMISSEMDNWKTSLDLREVDVISTALRQGKYGDASTFMVNSKKVFDAALAYGFTGVEGQMYWTDGTSDTAGHYYGIKFTLGQMINAGAADVRDGGVGLSVGALVGDLAAASPKSAFVARGDGAGGKWQRILVASSTSLETDRYFQITGGSDRQTPTIQFGTSASEVMLRYLSNVFQILDTGGVNPLLNINRVTKNADFYGGVKVGGTSGVRLTMMLEVTVDLDFPSIAAQSVQSLTVTLTGVASGDELTVTPITYASGLLNFVVKYEAADTVRVYCQNISASAIDPALQSLKIVAKRYST